MKKKNITHFFFPPNLRFFFIQLTNLALTSTLSKLSSPACVQGVPSHHQPHDRHLPTSDLHLPRPPLQEDLVLHPAVSHHLQTTLLLRPPLPRLLLHCRAHETPPGASPPPQQAAQGGNPPVRSLCPRCSGSRETGAAIKWFVFLLGLRKSSVETP